MRLWTGKVVEMATKKNSEAAPGPHSYRVSVSTFEGDGRQYRHGEVIDLRTVDPERVRRLLAARLIVEEHEYHKQTRGQRLREIKDRQREGMDSIGRAFSDRLRHEVADVEMRFNDQRDRAVAELRAKLLGERDAEVRGLLERLRTEAAAIADEADPLPPAA